MNDSKPASDAVREALALESGTLPWSELVREFARGVVVRVERDVELLDVGCLVASDDSAAFEQLLAQGRVARASDDDARRWVEREPVFRCVVVAPWVLVQELDG